MGFVMKIHLFTFLLVATGCTLAHATVLVDFSFDGVANDTGPSAQVVGSGGGTADLTTGNVEPGFAVSSPFSQLGFNTGSSVDASGGAGFTVEWVVTTNRSNAVGNLKKWMVFRSHIRNRGNGNREYLALV